VLWRLYNTHWAQQMLSGFKWDPGLSCLLTSCTCEVQSLLLCTILVPGKLLLALGTCH
jgi:hypothetical protein